MHPMIQLPVSAEAGEFVDLLRLELQEYGGMLDLLQSQQQGILRRDSESLFEMNLSLEHQAGVCHNARTGREHFVARAIRRFGLPAKSRIHDLIAHFAPELHPMLEALIEEIERLIHAIQQKARQNHMLLSRACDINQELLNWLQPGASTVTYTLNGKHLNGVPSRGLRCQTSA